MEKIYYPRTIDSYLLEWKNESAQAFAASGCASGGEILCRPSVGEDFQIFHGGEFRAGQRDYFGVHR